MWGSVYEGSGDFSQPQSKRTKIIQKTDPGLFVGDSNLGPFVFRVTKIKTLFIKF